jgi:hypothetical protein
MTSQLEFDFQGRPETGKPDVDEYSPVIIRLNKSFSWQSSYHKYPFYLAEADQERDYTRDEVYTEIFKTSSGPTNKKKHDWVNAIFGIEVDKEESEVIIGGIGLVEKVDQDHYRLTEPAVELGHSYARDPGGKSWRFTFAEILTKFDVRTRIVLYHIGILGYALFFPDDPTASGFGKTMKHAELVSRGERIPLFSNVRDMERVPGGRSKVFNKLLDHYRLEALGPFLIRKIEKRGLDLSPGIEFQGGRLTAKTFPEPSTNDLQLYLKQSLSLFVDIRVLIYDPARRAWVVDYPRANDVFSPGVTADLFTDRRDGRFLEFLREAYVAIADQDGLAQVRRLREQTCDGLGIPKGQRIAYFNRQVARLLSEGRLSIGSTLGWHASASDALFGDRSKEYVELLF